MPDDGVVQLRRGKANSRVHLSRHGKLKGSTTRLSKSTRTPSTTLHKANSSSQSLSSLNSQNSDTQTKPVETNVTGSHRMMKRALKSRNYKNLSGLSNLAQSYRKPVIQLEKDDDDDDSDCSNTSFEDLEDDEAKEPESEKVQLNVGIHPVEPTPPKLSDETVISVSSFADMASALKYARDKSGFVEDADLISTAVNRSKNLGDMAQMVNGWGGTNTNSKRVGISGNAPMLPNSSSSLSLNTRNTKMKNKSMVGEEDPREFEKVFREYTNARAVKNPVISSLCRISLANNSQSSNASSVYSSDSEINTAQYFNSVGRNSRLQMPAIKRINSLVATTSNQISDYSTGRGSALVDAWMSPSGSRAGANGGVPAYILNKIWQSGWDEGSPQRQTPTSSSDDIQSQAIRVQSRLARNKERSIPKIKSSIRLASNE